MASHYICTGGCQGVSAVPGSCRAENCPRRDLELKECSCDDHYHWGAFRSKKTAVNPAFSPGALAVAIGATAALASFINGLAIIIVAPETAPGLILTSIIFNSLAVGVGGLIAGALIAWIYNALRK